MASDLVPLSNAAKAKESSSTTIAAVCSFVGISSRGVRGELFSFSALQD